MHIAGGISGTILKFVVKTGEEGKLYGSITNKDIAEKILAEKNIEVDRKKLVFKVRTFTDDKTLGEGTHDRFIIDVSKFMNK